MTASWNRSRTPRGRLALLAAAACLVLSTPAESAAQRSGGRSSSVSASRARGVVPRYNPATPTTSPYLGLLVNSGGINSFYSIVRPRQDQARINLQQQTLVRNQSLRIDRVQTQLGLPAQGDSIYSGPINAGAVNGATGGGATPAANTARPSGWFGVPAVTSSHQNRSHYYQRWDERRLNLRR